MRKLLSSLALLAFIAAANAQTIFCGPPTQKSLIATLNPQITVTAPAATSGVFQQLASYAVSGANTYFADFAQMTITGSGTNTGGAHTGGLLAYVVNNNTNTLPLVIGTESRLDSTGIITTALIHHALLGNSSAAITNLYAYGLDIDNITAATTTLVGYNFPAVVGTAGNTTTPGTIYSYLNVEPAALTYSFGPITTTGAISSATATNTGLTSTNTFQLDTGTKTATATAGAATLNKSAGKITSEALTTAGLASYTLTLTDSQIAAADVVGASLAYGTNTTGTPVIQRVTPAAGSVVIVVTNLAAATAMNGTIVISFWVIKA